MKKISILVLTLLAVVLLASGKNASAAETTLKPYVPYAEDFERFAAGANGNTVYQDAGLFWFSELVSGTVIDVEGDKQLKYAINSVQSDNFAPLGGIGTGAINNLEKLVSGQKYHLSMYVDLSNVAAGSTLYIEYQTEHDWVGVTIVDGVVTPCDAAKIFNITYVNNVLEFDFMGYTHGGNLNKGYVKLTAYKMAVGNEVIFDDLLITEVIQPSAALLSLDFESNELGDAHGKTNVWNANTQVLTIQEENGNKYLYISNESTGQAWPSFYFNGLPVSSGVEYKVEFDVLEGNFERMYFVYNEANTPLTEEYEYGRNEFMNPVQSSTPSIGATSFDGSHFSVNFTPTTDKGQHWAQFRLAFYHNNSKLDVKLDNLKITPVVLQTAKSLSASVVNSFCVGEEVSASDLSVTLTRNNDLSRLLAAGEYTIDASQVNKDAAGEYPVIVKAVDEFGNEVSATTTVTYANHSWDEGVETTPATPDTEGVKTYTCGDCGATREESIDKLPKMVTIIFQSNWDWTGVNIYLWNSKGNNAWPGAPMELIGTTGSGNTLKNLYKYEFDANVYTQFIINGKNGEWNDQTADLNVSDYISGFADQIYYLTRNAENNANILGSYPYSAEGNLHLHDYSGYASDDNKHWHACSCGLRPDAVEEAHSWGEGEVTTAPTCTEAGVRTYTCLCGKTKTEEVGATGHTPGAAATCTEAQLCTVCEAEVAPATGHSHSTDWTKDETNHWHECACGDKADSAAHSGGEATETEKAVCEVCGQAYGELKQPTEQPGGDEPSGDEPSGDEPSGDEPTEEPKKGCGGSVVVSVLGVLALAGSVVVLRKKREE